MNRHVSIGGPITLMVLGAILYFALNAAVPGVNLAMVGLILMAAGAVWLVIGLIMGASKRSATTTEVTHGPTGTQEREIRTEDR